MEEITHVVIGNHFIHPTLNPEFGGIANRTWTPHRTWTLSIRQAWALSRYKLIADKALSR